MLIKKLFIKRFIQECRYQWGVIHTVLDGIVLIYVVIPALFLGVSFYVDAWKDISLYWRDYYPLVGLLFIILLLSSTGNFRTYTLNADLLFFVQRKEALYHLKAYGIILTLIKSLLQVMVVFAIVLPVLVLVYRFSHQEIGLLFLFVSGYKLLIMTIKKAFKRLLYQRLLSLLIFIAALLSITNIPAEFYGPIGLLLIVSTIVFQLKVAKSNHQFYREIEIESMERHKYIEILIATSVAMGSPVEIEKTSTYQRKKPLFLFRGSKRIFKVRSEENGLLEFCLKAFLRNKSYRTSYFQVISVTSLLITFLPFWIKIAIYGISILFFRSWMKGIYLKIVQHSFFQVVKVDKRIVFSTQKRFLIWTVTPAVILLGVLLLFSIKI